MVLAVRAAQENEIKMTIRCLLLTLGLASGFLVVKGFEYHKDIVDHLVPGPHFAPELPPRAQLFFWLYWVMTGLHALHVIVGMGLLSVMTWLARRGKFSAEYHTPIEVVGLYWHFVDIVWIFLYPLLYLINRHA
jgi:cytochrome c oxidase subunit 3